MTLAGMKLAMTTAYYPQADGQSERTNRTIETTLRIIILKSTEQYSLTVEEIAADLVKRRTEAEGALKRIQMAQKRYYNGKHVLIKFLPGDLVVQVVEVVLLVAYRIKVPQGSKMHDVISIEHLWKYKVREGTANPTPIIDMINEPKIRKILGERMWKDRQETLGDDLSLLKEFRERSEGVMKESEGTKTNENSGRTMIDGIAMANEEDLEEKSGLRRSSRTKRLP
ncbi:hypothetical protein EV426DRAFT_604520 [Tirmania nivea]|nr:hypothetical protein EV426DRAFT_604520 [Tirmania nivea]